ncbi:MAG: MBOAT family protein [Clostridia bacterium]|nr:MBOAT family protein [Clostridia bacterium]
MVFSTLTFVYLFLPVTVILYFLLPSLKAKNIILTVMSLLFYAWGEPIFLFLMLFTALLNFVCGLLIDRTEGKKKKAWLVVSVVLNLGMLGFFKYAGFILENLSALTRLNLPMWQIALPIGISFYTFQSMTYTIDVYRGDAAVQRSFYKLLLYISMFPQLIAGPIVRYADVSVQIEQRKTTLQGAANGITRFLIGMGKKLLIANYCGKICTSLLAEGSSGTVLGGWVGLIMFAFQIYFDFSAYSDMAIGLGHIFGFNFKENFNYPYTATSITDFWRRWHISLSSFFRDYVYIPLGGNRRMQVRNIFVVWLLTGFWHGAEWNFMLWGVYFGILLLLEKFVFAKLIAALPKLITRAVTLFLVLMSWALFYFTSLEELGSFFMRIFGAGGGAAVSDALLTLLENNSLLIAVCILASLPLGRLVGGLRSSMIRDGGKLENVALSLNLIFNLVVFAVCTVVMVTETYNPFLYFRF